MSEYEINNFFIAFYDSMLSNLEKKDSNDIQNLNDDFYLSFLKINRLISKAIDLFHNSQIFKKIEENIDINLNNIISQLNGDRFCMNEIFSKNIDLCDFNKTNITNMKDMFNGCIELEFLDLSNFDTSNVTDMSRIFDCMIKMKSNEFHETVKYTDKYEYPLLKYNLVTNYKMRDKTNYLFENINLFNKVLFFITQKYCDNISKKEAKNIRLKDNEININNNELFYSFMKFYNNLELEDIIEKLSINKPLSDFSINNYNNMGKTYKTIYEYFINPLNRLVGNLSDQKIEKFKLKELDDLSKNKNLLFGAIDEFFNRIINLLLSFKRQYSIKNISLDDELDIYNFISENSNNSDFHKKIINDLIELIKLLSDESFYKEKNISGETKLREVIEIKDSISDSLKQLFENNEDFTVNKIIGIADYYIKLISETTDEETKKYKNEIKVKKIIGDEVDNANECIHYRRIKQADDYEYEILFSLLARWIK